MVPSHIYYSSAYYQTPGAPTMDTKKSTGADLIFDLDADHLVRGPYPVMLSRVREETVKLLAMLTEGPGFRKRRSTWYFLEGEDTISISGTLPSALSGAARGVN